MSKQPHWVTLGKVTRTRGLRGEFFLDAALPRDLAKGTAIRLRPPDTDFALQSLGEQKDRALMKLAGIDTIEAAEAVRGSDVLVLREALGEEILLSDLVGCALVDAESGRPIGTVTEWIENPGNDLLQLDTGMLVPYVEAFFPEINLETRQIKARLPAGLDEL